MQMKESFEEQLIIIDKLKSHDLEIEIVEMKHLKGSQNPLSAMHMLLAQQSGMRLRQIRVKLNGGAIKTEAGALYFSKGHIDCDTQVGGLGGAFGKMLKSTLNSESTFKPVYRGQGELYLEPTFGHFIMLNIKSDSVIVDKGFFYACSANMTVEPVIQSNVSSALLGGEGVFQTKISGTGFIILQIPVPQEEILKYDLDNERLQVDGNFAILRTNGIKFSVQKSSKTLVSSLLNGEGLLQTFDGTGQVWLAPTANVYKNLEIASYSGVNLHSKSMNNKQ